ncbi:MAG: hypothetical protein QOH61_2609 [Chloroflexota bacterium]|jgi:hypothetical protein|nr:hypothetical protein [Chloroflexota bacterium]
MAETQEERIDRELIELLNELRVALPGVQVLFAFLLVLPFQQTFTDATDLEHALYFVAFLATTAASVFLIAPSTYHRIRFRDGDKERMLTTSNRLLLAGTGCMAVAITMVAFLIGEHLYGDAVGIGVAAATAALLGWFWYGLALRRKLADKSGGARPPKT